eukprot:14353-Pelagococcus_subviridis.AAC.2
MQLYHRDVVAEPRASPPLRAGSRIYFWLRKKELRRREDAKKTRLRVLAQDDRPPSERAGMHDELLRAEHPGRSPRRDRGPRVVEIVPEPSQKSE